MSRFEHRVSGDVVDVRARRDADSAYLCGECIGDVVTVEIRRSHHVVIARPRQDLLQECVGDHVLDDDPLGKHLPWPAFMIVGTEFRLRHLVPPVAERALGVLHDVALVNECHTLALLLHRMPDRRAYQPCGSFLRDRLDANAARIRKTDRGSELVLQVGDESACFLAPGAVLDSRVDVLGVLAEHDHIHIFRPLDRGGHAGEMPDGADAGIEIQLLAQRYVERTEPSADWCRQRPLDRHQVMADGSQRIVRQPALELVLGLLAGQHLEPVDPSVVAIGAPYRVVEDVLRRAPDVGSGAVSFNERDDRLVGHGKRALAHGDWLPRRRRGERGVARGGRRGSHVPSRARVGGTAVAAGRPAQGRRPSRRECTRQCT